MVGRLCTGSKEGAEGGPREGLGDSFAPPGLHPPLPGYKVDKRSVSWLSKHHPRARPPGTFQIANSEPLPCGHCGATSDLQN